MLRRAVDVKNDFSGPGLNRDNISPALWTGMRARAFRRGDNKKKKIEKKRRKKKNPKKEKYCRGEDV